MIEAKTNEGIWGDWKDWKYVPSGSLACGAKLKYESYRGKKDDTSGNGLELAHCDINNWYDQGTTLIHTGDWGSWDKMKYCPEYHYIISMNVRMEKN